MPKFFMDLGFRYSNDGHQYSHPPAIYGPYENDLAVQHAIQTLYPNDKEKSFLVFDGQIVKVTPSPLEKPEAEKREPGKLNNYLQVGSEWKCKNCGATVIAGRIAHPVHLREMPGTGPGECQYEDVPYCPNCDKKPNFNGAPVLR